MDVTFFGLTSWPFQGVPDPDDVYASPAFLDAYDALRHVVEGAGGMALLTGREGAGKTTMLRQVQVALRSRNCTVLSIDAGCGPEAVLEASKTIQACSDQAYEAGEATQDLDCDEFQDRLPEREVVVLLDDAHALPAGMLERLWDLLRSERFPNLSVSVVLSATPEFERRLQAPELAGLRGALERRVALAGLDGTEARGYISRKLDIAGHQGEPLFTDGAVQSITGHTEGLPGRIDALCAKALAAAYASGQRVVDRALVEGIVAPDGDGAHDDSPADAAGIVATPRTGRAAREHPQPLAARLTRALSAAAAAIARAGARVLAGLRRALSWWWGSKHDRRRGLRSVHAPRGAAGPAAARVSGSSYSASERDWLGLKVGFVAISVIAVLGALVALIYGPFSSTADPPARVSSDEELLVTGKAAESMLSSRLTQDEIDGLRAERDRLNDLLRQVRESLRDSQATVSEQKAQMAKLVADIEASEARVAALRNARPVTVMLPDNVQLTFSAPNGERLEVKRRSINGESVRPVAIAGQLKAEAVDLLKSLSAADDEMPATRRAEEVLAAAVTEPVTPAATDGDESRMAAGKPMGPRPGQAAGSTRASGPETRPATSNAGPDLAVTPPEAGRQPPGSAAAKERSRSAQVLAQATAAPVAGKAPPPPAAPAPASSSEPARVAPAASPATPAAAAQPAAGTLAAAAPVPEPGVRGASTSESAPVDDRSTFSRPPGAGEVVAIAEKIDIASPASEPRVVPAAIVDSSRSGTKDAVRLGSPAATPARDAKVIDPLYYEVAAGDTLSGLARRFDVTVSALREWNQLSGDDLKVGQRLSIQPPAGTPVVGRAGKSELDEALLGAAAAGTLAQVDTLLGRGAALEATDDEGKTPLVLAASKGHLQVVQRLADRGARIDARSRSGGTALSFAAWNGHHVVLSALLRRGAKVDTRANDGWTPLMYASINGHEQSVRRLLAHGADVNARSSDSRTALLAAVWNGRVRVARALLDKGARVNETTRDGWTPLLYAAWNGQKELVEVLLEYGADPSISNARGLTPVAAAAQRGHPEIASALSRSLASSS